MIPSYVKKYFWDAKIAEKDLKQHTPYIIERILEYGDEKTVHWMFQKFKKSQISKTLETGRNLSPQSAYFWALIMGISKNKILCLKKQFRARRSKHWIW